MSLICSVSPADEGEVEETKDDEGFPAAPLYEGGRLCVESRLSTWCVWVRRRGGSREFGAGGGSDERQEETCQSQEDHGQEASALEESAIEEGGCSEEDEGHEEEGAQG